MAANDEALRAGPVNSEQPAWPTVIWSSPDKMTHPRFVWGVVGGTSEECDAMLEVIELSVNPAQYLT